MMESKMSKRDRVYRMDEKPEGADEKKPIPAPITVGQQKKAHVELYLRATGVPIWERGGKKAFAVSKGCEFGTDTEFEQLFKAY
jgi:hypothetical protein